MDQSHREIHLMGSELSEHHRKGKGEGDLKDTSDTELAGLRD